MEYFDAKPIENLLHLPVPDIVIILESKLEGDVDSKVLASLLPIVLWASYGRR